MLVNKKLLLKNKISMNSNLNNNKNIFKDNIAVKYLNLKYKYNILNIYNEIIKFLFIQKYEEIIK